jgi:long-chain acyl-CoA synthetase
VMSFDALEALGADFETSHTGLVDTTIHGQTLAQIGLIIYTSGSTGKPKGAMLSYKNIRAQAIASVDRLSLSRDESLLSYLPLCHVAEQMTTVMVPVYLGSLVNFGESIRTVQEDLREVAPSMFLGVPRSGKSCIRRSISSCWRLGVFAARCLNAPTPRASRLPRRSR